MYTFTFCMTIYKTILPHHFSPSLFSPINAVGTLQAMLNVHPKQDVNHMTEGGISIMLLVDTIIRAGGRSRTNTQYASCLKLK